LYIACIVYMYEGTYVNTMRVAAYACMYASSIYANTHSDTPIHTHSLTFRTLTNSYPAL